MRHGTVSPPANKGLKAIARQQYLERVAAQTTARYQLILSLCPGKIGVVQGDRFFVALCKADLIPKHWVTEHPEGGDLARQCTRYAMAVLQLHNYIVEHDAADSPSAERVRYCKQVGHA